MTKYIVCWNKRFTSGNLKGLEYPSRLDFNNILSATEYVKFLCAHAERPVTSFDSSCYTCHDVKLDSELIVENEISL